jgi:DNA replication and repair protein RecF
MGEGAMSAHGLTRLVLTDFRSYGRAEIVTDARPVVLVGLNGAGKTNLLEAISMLSPGRGLRGAKLSEMTRSNGEDADGRAWAVAATVADPVGETLIGTGLVSASEGTGEKRSTRLNGVPTRSTETLAEVFRVLWLTPAMDRLFLEAASGRRRFLDRIVLIFDPAHARRVNAYEKATRERMRLLRDGRGTPAWLDGLERQMVEHGIAIAAARREGIARLMQSMAEATSAFPSAELALSGSVEASLGETSALEAEDSLLRALEASRARDTEAGRTLVGPHTSDMVAVHSLKQRRAEECSTGEQKALLVSIILAAARMERHISGGLTPVLLLDEIAAHLDAVRRAALFDELCALGAQAWMTGTDAALFGPLGSRAQHFNVSAGRLVRQET